MYLIDTNIFLEILLSNPNKTNCETFLYNNIGYLNISDFSLHSIGVILSQRNKLGLYLKFIRDIIPRINVVTIPTSYYICLAQGKGTYNLDFDDAFQYCVAKYQGLNLVTQDKHFQGVTDITVQFL
jgi:predicted nucleic acid-binding protein